MSQLKLEKHSSRKRGILLIIKLLIILVSVLGCAKNETYRDNIVPDISVNDIKLSDTTAVVLGYSDLKYNIIEGKEELPYAIFTNKNKTEILKLYLFYGTKRNEFYQAEISPYDKKQITEGTKNILTLFIGVMMGANAANKAINELSKIASKEVAGRGISKLVPILGALTSGGLTYFSFKEMAVRLRNRLKQEMENKY